MVALEGMEPAIQIYVVGNHDAVEREGLPCMSQLEEEVPSRVRAVMDEQIDRPDARKQGGEATPARSTHVGPSVMEAPWHGNPDLSVKAAVEWRWKVDAPQMTRTVSFERFQDEPRRNTPCHAGLDHLLGTQVVG
jgi:hypothetical protein